MYHELRVYIYIPNCNLTELYNYNFIIQIKYIFGFDKFILIFQCYYIKIKIN